jgi:hypothetical protein
MAMAALDTPEAHVEELLAAAWAAGDCSAVVAFTLAHHHSALQVRSISVLQRFGRTEALFPSVAAAAVLVTTALREQTVPASYAAAAMGCLTYLVPAGDPLLLARHPFQNAAWLSETVELVAGAMQRPAADALPQFSGCAALKSLAKLALPPSACLSAVHAVSLALPVAIRLRQSQEWRVKRCCCFARSTRPATMQLCGRGCT